MLAWPTGFAKDFSLTCSSHACGYAFFGTEIWAINVFKAARPLALRRTTVSNKVKHHPYHTSVWTD